MENQSYVWRLVSADAKARTKPDTDEVVKQSSRTARILVDTKVCVCRTELGKKIP